MMTMALFSTDTKNTDIKLVIDLLSASATCKFAGESSIKTCSITYGPRGNCDVHHPPSGTQEDLENVVISFPEIRDHERRKEFCYFATASNGTHTIVIEGEFYTGA